jgi:hypothetical protein
MVQAPVSVAAEAGVKWAVPLRQGRVVIVFAQTAVISSRMLSDSRVIKERARSAVRK